ncbi:MAG: hypothetical protein SFT90_05065 [Rickettsiales bacterium]|nr:hypothetical protein [Rickettsiales bacterium]
MPSTIQLYNQSISDIKRLQNDLFSNQAKIGADSIASTYKELGSNISVIEGFKSSIERSDRFISSIDQVLRRLDTMYRAVDDIVNTAINFRKSLGLEATSTNSSVFNLTQEANSTLDRIRGSLNEKDGAAFVFSGAKSDVEPVNDLKNSTNILNGQNTSNYYNGDDFISKVSASVTLEVDYGVTASNPAFKNLIASINRAKATEASGEGANYDQAGTELENAIDELISLRASIGNNTKVLEQMQEFHTRAKATFEIKFDEKNSPDIIELTTKTSQLTATLQASYLNFSKISQLNLSSFL